MANYYEIFLNPRLESKNLDENIKVYNTSLDKNEFKYLLSCVSRGNHNFKFFQKEYKEYIYDNVITHNYKNTETRIFKNTPISIIQHENSLVIGYNKSKLTFLSMPSTTNIYNINYVKKLIFRVNNRIFINFQISQNDKDNSQTYQAYINYNHESNIDPEEVNKTMKKIYNIFGFAKLEFGL
jgi:hypothetical protein